VGSTWHPRRAAEARNRDLGLGEDHLRRVLSEYASYYHCDRTDCSLEKDMPFHRPIEPRSADTAQSVALPDLGGLRRRYERREAA